jgi:pimeloyl-ACP methyl ester carboxylesterase
VATSTDVTELDIEVAGGRRLHAYDTAGAGAGGLPVFWCHGTPNTGAPPEPLFPVADRLGIRWVSYDRPGYGGSSPHPDRSVGSAAGDVAAVADALSIERFGVVGYSGGGPHALACGARLPDRVVGVVGISGLAPYDADGLDWFAGMTEGDQAALRAAVAGRAAKEAYEASGAEMDLQLTPGDIEALSADWAWLANDVITAVMAGPGGSIDDDLAFVNPWGFSPADITVPLLLLHGGSDGVVPPAHTRWLADHCPTAALRLTPDDGHVSVLAGVPAALEWLVSQAG